MLDVGFHGSLGAWSWLPAMFGMLVDVLAVVQVLLSAGSDVLGVEPGVPGVESGHPFGL